MPKPRVSTTALSMTAVAALLTGIGTAAAQTAPGSGSFPGSFLVPGTNTSIGLHGFIQFDVYRDFGPHIGDTASGATTAGGVNSIPLDAGPGVAAGSANLINHATNGGLRLTAQNTRMWFETRTPSSFGEIKTYIEWDFNLLKNLGGQGASGTGTPSVGAGNAEALRLRLAYGTWGPLLFGQAYSNYIDLQSWPETLNGEGGDPGTMNVVDGRVPQIRYTWLGPSGLALAGSLEMPFTVYGSAGTKAAPGTVTAFTSDNLVGGGGNTGGGIQDWPSVVGSAELDQPWGDVSGHAAYQRLQARSGNIDPFTGTAFNHNANGYAVSVAGHLNTIGKDALRGGVNWEKGAVIYISNVNDAGLIENAATGSWSETQAWGAWGGYTHWWTELVRSTLHGGYISINKPDAAVNLTTAGLAGLNKNMYTLEANLIYSPTPQLDFGTEWQHFYRKVFSGASGRDDRLQLQAKIKF